jgi:hypothetical protein
MNMTDFDVFLSHNSIDKPWVIQLKDDLTRYGLKVWLDKDEIRPGDLFAEALEDALENCKAIALIISPQAMDSGWVKEEYYRAVSLSKSKQLPLQMIPVILREAEVPGFAKSRNWIDFRDENQYNENVWRLVWGISGHKPAKVLDLAAPTHQTMVDRPDIAGNAKAPVRPGKDKDKGPVSRGKREAVDRRRSKNAVVFNQKGQTVGTQTNIGKMSGGFVNTGMTVHGKVQQAGRDIVMGDRLEAGRDIHQVNESLTKFFRDVIKRAESLPEEEQTVVKPTVEMVRNQVVEIQQSGIEDETSPKYTALKKGLKTLVEWVPDIADVVLGFLSSPATGIVSAVRQVAERIKSERK